MLAYIMGELAALQQSGKVREFGIVNGWIRVFFNGDSCETIIEFHANNPRGLWSNWYSLKREFCR